MTEATAKYARELLFIEQQLNKILEASQTDPALTSLVRQDISFELAHLKSRISDSMETILCLDHEIYNNDRHN